MKSTFAWSLALGFSAVLAACGNSGAGSGATAVADTAAVTTSAPATTAAATATATAAATATATATDAPAASGAPSASASASATASVAASGSPAASGSAAAGARKFDCGEKGQKQCPMQGWMKSALSSAMASGDPKRISSALSYIAGKPPAGMAGAWSAIAAAGAAKAAAGDIDGAKASCKQCHDKYKYKYITTMRDQPW